MTGKDSHNKVAALQQYAAFYDQYRDTLQAHTVLPLRQQQQTDWKSFLELFPSKSYRESFKYTDALTAFAPQYGLNIMRRQLCDVPYSRYRCGAEQLGTDVLFVVNDVVVPPQKPFSLPDGAYIGSFANCPPFAINALNDILADKSFRDASDPSFHLCNLLSQDGVLIHIPDGTKLSRPLQIVNMSDATQPMMSNRRLVIHLGKNAEACITVCDHAMGNTAYLTTQNVSVSIECDSRLQFYNIEETTDTTTRFLNLQAIQGTGSELVSNFITLHCGLSRNTVRVLQRGEDCLTEIDGAVIADGAQHADTHATVIHSANTRGGRSDMLFKQAVGGRATAAFTGVVEVQENAARIESEQQSRNLLLTDTAHAFSRPVLKIFADDVKCSHGSTTGKFDSEALFYMQQRGISEDEAKLLLRHAFIYDALQRIRLTSLRQRLSLLAEHRMRGGCDTCEGCAVAPQS